MTYNFDMDRLLETFDGDPEKLANAFADALNDKLAEKRKKDYIDEAAGEVADAWECFVDEYFEQNELPKGYNLKDFYVDANTVKNVLQLIIKALPYFQVLGEYAEKLEELNKAVRPMAQEVKDQAVNKSKDFEAAMQKFFNKNNI